MLKTLLLPLFIFALHTECAAQLKTIEVKKKFWSWTGTQYYMGGQKIRVPEIQLHLDKYHPEAGKAFRRGSATYNWGWAALGASSGVLLYDVIEQSDNQSSDALFLASLGLFGASIYLFDKGQVGRNKALRVYNAMVYKQERR